jgi:hypothetical protein
MPFACQLAAWDKTVEKGAENPVPKCWTRPSAQASGKTASPWTSRWLCVARAKGLIRRISQPFNPVLGAGLLQNQPGSGLTGWSDQLECCIGRRQGLFCFGDAPIGARNQYTIVAIGGGPFSTWVGKVCAWSVV